MTTIGVVVHGRKRFGRGPEVLRAALADAGHPDPPWQEIDKAKQAPKRVRRLLGEGVDRLLVWGGDGTVRRSLGAVVEEGSRTEVAILPAGTANLLANALGVPIDLARASQVALAGRPRPIDLGRINDEVFAVMAGCGFDALLMRDADAGKERLGRLAYVRAGLRHIGTAGARADVVVDGERWFHGRAACVLAGNVGRILGGVELFPAATCDDGVLDVGVLTARSLGDWLRVGARAAVGRIDASPHVQITQGRRVEVRLDRPLPWQLDGGDRRATDRLAVEVLPSAVSLLVPR